MIHAFHAFGDGFALILPGLAVIPLLSWREPL